MAIRRGGSEGVLCSAAKHKSIGKWNRRVIRTVGIEILLRSKFVSGCINKRFVTCVAEQAGQRPHCWTTWNITYNTPFHWLQKGMELCTAVQARCFRVCFYIMFPSAAAPSLPPLNPSACQSTVPNVFVKGKHVGGNDAVQAANASGALKELLEG